MAANIPDLPPGDTSTSISRLLIATLVLMVVLVLGYFALGMPGMDHRPATELDDERMDM